jgi:hypothetical protein
VILLIYFRIANFNQTDPYLSSFTHANIDNYEQPLINNRTPISSPVKQPIPVISSPSAPANLGKPLPNLYLYQEGNATPGPSTSNDDVGYDTVTASSGSKQFPVRVYHRRQETSTTKVVVQPKEVVRDWNAEFQTISFTYLPSHCVRGLQKKQ